MKKNRIRQITISAAAIMLATAMGGKAHAEGITVTFSAAGISCLNSALPDACVEADNIWNTGDFISETFSGTGLASVNQLSLNLSLLNDLYLGVTESWAIDLNGTQVGTLSESGPSADAITYSQTFDFASIAGPDYTVLFTVLAPGVILTNHGTLGLETGREGRTSTATLSSGSSTTVPEPSSLPLFLMGAAGIGAAVVHGKTIMKSKA